MAEEDEVEAEEGAEVVDMEDWEVIEEEIDDTVMKINGVEEIG